MTLNRKIRFVVLGLLFGQILLTLGRGIVTSAPIKEKNAIDNFSFPENVPLPGWQIVSSASLPHSGNPNLDSLASRNYQYSQDDLLLNIEMRYLKVGDGDIQKWIKSYKSLPTSFTVYREEGIGAYALLVHHHKINLSSCINPRGESTVTTQQYFRNKFLSDINLPRFGSWLIGRHTLIDKRCLWTHISLDNSTSQFQTNEIYRRLKTAWTSWHYWWQKNYPQS